MATGTILLPILAAVSDPTNPPGLAFTATDSRPYLTFDDGSNIEGCVWSFRMPENYSSAPVAKIQWSGSSSTTTSHTCQWSVFVMALTANTDGAADAEDFAAENVVADDILGTTAKRIQEVSLTLTNNDNLAANDYVTIQLLRDYTDATDDLPEDAWLWGMSLEYTTT